MRSSFVAGVLVASVVALGAVAFSSCGSVTPASDGGAAGSSGGGTTGAGGTTGVAGTTGASGNGGASVDGGVLTCRTDVANDCPQGFTCACGGAGPVGMCTCHKNCTDTSQCGAVDPMCGCPGATTGAPRYCVNACFCTCQ
jgi:hypothetical protein